MNLETMEDLQLAILKLQGKLEIQERLLAPALMLLSRHPPNREVLQACIALITAHASEADRTDSSPHVHFREQARDQMLEDLAVYREAIESGGKQRGS